MTGKHHGHEPPPDDPDRSPDSGLDPKADRTIEGLEAVFLGLLGLLLVALIILAVISVTRG